MARLQALQPKEALAYWGDRVSITADDFKTLDAAAKARAFTVSGLARQDMVEQIHASLAEALASGESLASWRKKVGPVLEKAGIRSKARLDTIFRTNTQHAYQAGRFAQMSRTTTARPFWRYAAVGDKRTRPSHMALHGRVARHDDDFWSQFYPPNGFNCRCMVQSLSERQVAAQGLQVESGLPGPAEVVNPVTGEVVTVTPAPDPGFGRNAGRDWLSGVVARELETRPKDLLDRAICRNGKALFADEACKPPLATLDPRHIHKVTAKDILPANLTSEEYVKAFLAEFGLADLSASKLVELPGGFRVPISSDLFWDQKEGKLKARRGGRGPYVKLLARTIRDPFEVWYVPVGVGKRTRPAIRCLRLFATPDKQIGGYGSWTWTGREWHGSTLFTPKADRPEQRILEYMERDRVGVLIYREELEAP